MNQSSFHGGFNGGDFDAVLDVLRAWLKTRDRIEGMEIFYERPGMSVFCQGDRSAPIRQPCYLMDGTTDAPPEEAADWLRPLLQLCRARTIEFSLEYEPVNEDGDAIGDEVALK